MDRGDPAAELMKAAAVELQIPMEEVRSISVHGPAALGYIDEGSELLVVLRGGRPPRFQRARKIPGVDLVITLGEEEFRRDCEGEELGGLAAGALILPYAALSGREFLDECEVAYKRHVALESLQNLILEHRLASRRLLIKPAYFVYDKLRRLCSIYPPIRPYVDATFRRRPERSLEASLKGFEKALEQLVEMAVLVRRGAGHYTPTEKIIHETLSKISIYGKLSRDLEHVFKMYLAAGLSSPLEAVKELGFDIAALKPVKLPDPSEMIQIETSLGPQPLLIDLGIEEFIERAYGVSRDEVRLRRIAGVLNSAYAAVFRLRGSIVKIFVKRFLNWTDFKWVAAWLWAIGVKNFSLLASVRMSNEIYFVNKLMELGFDVAEILHVNWPRKIIFQRYVEGRDLARVLASCSTMEEIRETGSRVGELLGRLHHEGICMGDCNPFSFIFSNDGRIYLVDLEQCSYDESFSWDIAELLYYTSRYLEGEGVRGFTTGFVDGYLKIGRSEELLKAMDSRYARVLAPLTPPGMRSKIKEAVIQAVGR